MKNENLHQVIRRNGDMTPFDPVKIRTAIANSFIKAELGYLFAGAELELSDRQRDAIDDTTNRVVAATLGKHPGGRAIPSETIVDLVKLCLTLKGELLVAREYVRHRAKQAEKREGAVQPADGECVQLFAQGVPARPVANVGSLTA